MTERLSPITVGFQRTVINVASLRVNAKNPEERIQAVPNSESIRAAVFLPEDGHLEIADKPWEGHAGLWLKRAGVCQEEGLNPPSAETVSGECFEFEGERYLHLYIDPSQEVIEALQTNYPELILLGLGFKPLPSVKEASGA